MAVPVYFYTHQNLGPEGTLQLTGTTGNPVNVTVSELKTFPSVTIQVTLTSSSKPQDNGIFNYTGVTLRDILEQTYAVESAKSVYVQAVDGYGTTLTIAEAMDQNTIIAYAKDGVELMSLQNGGEGPARLIIGGDKYAQRWVKGVVAITVS
ncbi:MAG: molybdopterin-dependent oxidoreductase [Candidatus Bathyarchaeota archaeon]|nr:molybdopterin-dependent oxidoreductase [Candidatus Bathyarchaeum sp.]